MLRFGSDIFHQSPTALCNKDKYDLYKYIIYIGFHLFISLLEHIWNKYIIGIYFLAYRIHFQTKQVFVNLCENLHGEIFCLHMKPHMKPVALILLIWLKCTHKNVPNNGKCGCTTRQ